MLGKVDWSALLGAFLKLLRISSSLVPLHAVLTFHMPFGYLHSLLKGHCFCHHF